MFLSLPVRREGNHLLGGWPAYDRTRAVMVKVQTVALKSPGTPSPGLALPQEQPVGDTLCTNRPYP